MKQCKMLLAVVLVVVLLCGCGSKKSDVIRELNWGMTKEKVLASEEKMDDTNEGIEVEGVYIFDGAKLYDVTAIGLTYTFDEEEKLVKITWLFNSDYGVFETLMNGMESDYGEGEKRSKVTNGADIYDWETDSSLINLMWSDSKSADGGMITITFEEK